MLDAGGDVELLDDGALPDEFVAHWRKIATPAHVAMTCGRGSMRWLPYRHLLYINDLLVQAEISREQTFLNIQASVRHGKSVLTTVWNVVWFMGTFPGVKVAIICGNENLAKRFSRLARDIFKEHGEALFGKSVRPEVSAVNEWGLSDGSLCRAVGVGGQLSGDGFDLMVIDDPITKAEEARSATTKAAMVEWYAMDVRTRLSPTGTMILTMARWTADDISATILETARRAGEDADPWVEVKLPAIAEAPRGTDIDTWRDELGRADGEALWPEVWPVTKLRRIKASQTDPRSWDALYQQNPVPKTGNLFEFDAWQTLEKRPVYDDFIAMVRSWDIAGTKNAGDWTVGTLLGKFKPGHPLAGRCCLLDVVRRQVAPDARDTLVLETAARDGRQVRIVMETPKGDSKTTGHHYSVLLAGYDFTENPVKGGKEERADLFAAVQRRGLVHIPPDVEWFDLLRTEYARFPNGGHDDQVDAGALGYNFLFDAGETEIILPPLVSLGSSRAPLELLWPDESPAEDQDDHDDPDWWRTQRVLRVA